MHLGNGNMASQLIYSHKKDNKTYLEKLPSFFF